MSEWQVGIVVGGVGLSTFYLWSINKQATDAAERLRQILVLLARERGHDV